TSLTRLGESVFICAPCSRFPRLAMPANMRNYSAPGQLPISKGAASRGTFSRPRKTPSTGNAGHIKKTNPLKKTNLLRKLHVATVSEEHRQRYLPEPVAAGAGSSGIYKKTNSFKKTRKLRKPLVATVAQKDRARCSRDAVILRTIRRLIP